jgi:hypothetical protein
MRRRATRPYADERNFFKVEKWTRGGTVSTTAANNHSLIIFVMGRMAPGASPPIQAARFAATPPRPDPDTVNFRVRQSSRNFYVNKINAGNRLCA